MDPSSPLNSITSISSTSTYLDHASTANFPSSLNRSGKYPLDESLVREWLSTSAHDPFLPLANPVSRKSYARLIAQMSRLCSHVYTKGLLEAQGFDVVIRIPAWNKEFRLHKLVLSQNAFFDRLLLGRWKEAGEECVELHFDDTNITPESFHIAIGKLYGRLEDPIHDQNVCSLLATACFLQMDDFSDACAEYILRTLSPSNVAKYLSFVDGHCYGSVSARIVEAAFTYLCRDAYSDPRLRSALVEIPIQWLQRLVESDFFWVPGEYERYSFVKEIVGLRREKLRLRKAKGGSKAASGRDTNSRVGSKGNEGGVKETSERVSMECTKEQHWVNMGSMSGEGESTPQKERREDGGGVEHVENAEGLHKEEMAVEEEEEGEEEEEKEEEDEDEAEEDEEPFYLEMFAHAIIYAHMSFEELNSIKRDIDPATGKPYVPDDIIKDALWQQVELRTRIMAASETDEKLGIVVGEHEPHPTRHIIPDADYTKVGESIANATSASHQHQHQRQQDEKEKPRREYSRFAPFRFSIEFTDVSALKEKHRVYSHTVFYAGSNWNLYIQKIRGPRRNMQLGVYLHRQSSSPDSAAGELVVVERELDGTTTTTRTSLGGSGTSHFSLYTDRRLRVKTWFKIVCASHGPSHMLTQFQSTPDDFKLMQSWGWRSTTLCSEDYSASEGNPDVLRFSIVMGHV
ncbi:uncharacterized protein VTP21DRAFT_2858 [Calcarisporiella thermophila]|uniref:uncharacterized protein n=1 Tax=Calcarisporiella thermophila TaxID=911321 RepID=UPI0037429AB8